MNRTQAVLGTLAFLLLAPGTVVGLIPWLLSKWQLQSAFFGAPFTRWFGSLLVASGIALLLDTFARFAFEGVGTPAPVAPTKTLVIRGPYRVVRNPMYTAIVLLIVGQAIMLGNIFLLGYGAVTFLVTHLFVVFYEEPRLGQKFGSQYEDYCGHVGRWLPRFRAFGNEEPS